MVSLSNHDLLEILKNFPEAQSYKEPYILQNNVLPLYSLQTITYDTRAKRRQAHTCVENGGLATCA